MEQGVTLDTHKIWNGTRREIAHKCGRQGPTFEKKNAIIEKLMEKAIIGINCNSLEKKQQQRLTTWLLFWPTF